MRFVSVLAAGIAAAFGVMAPVPVLAAGSLTWNLATGGNWDTTTENWTGDGDQTMFTDDGTVDVTFDKTNGGTITISPEMSPQSTTVSAVSGTYTFISGPIDSGSLTKSGGGTLAVDCTNNFSGGITLNSGKLSTRYGAAIGGGTITFNGGTISDIFNNACTYTNAVVISGGFAKDHNAGCTFSGPVTLTGSYAITNLRNTVTFSGVVSDGGNGYGITLQNNRTDATMSLGGADSTYTGKTILKGGGTFKGKLLNAGVPCGFGQPTGANAVIDIYNGGKLALASGSDSDRTINIAGDGVETYEIGGDSNFQVAIGSISLTGTGKKTLSLVNGGNPGKLTIRGNIPDASDGSQVNIAVKWGSSSGGNFLNLDGTNTFSGTIAVGTAGAGPLKIGGSGCLGSGIFTNTISIASGSTFDYASSVTQELSGAISGAGTFKASGPGVVKLTASSNSVGSVTLASNGTLQVGPRSGSAALYVANNINVANGVTNSTLALDITGGDVLVNVAGSLVYAGTHTTYLKITGGGQETPIISCGGTVATFDYVVYNDTTNTWAEAQVLGSLSGYGGSTQLRINGSDVYIDPLPPSGTLIQFM
jgi:autotransporter-associated beta strand protein